MGGSTQHALRRAVHPVGHLEARIVGRQGAQSVQDIFVVREYVTRIVAQKVQNAGRGCHQHGALEDAQVGGGAGFLVALLGQLAADLHSGSNRQSEGNREEKEAGGVIIVKKYICADFDKYFTTLFN